MTLPATDNFNRTNANPIGGNWTTVPGANAMQITSNAAAGTSDPSCAYWNADSFAGDHYAQIVTPVNTDPGFWIGPAVRCSASQLDCYFLLIKGSANNARIYKFVNGSATLLASLDYAFSGGDTHRLEVVGTLLTVYLNGVSKGTANDSALSGGAAGIVANGTTPTLDDWEGGNVGGVPTVQLRLEVGKPRP